MVVAYHGGDRRGMDDIGKGRAMLETAAGAGLVSLPWWGHVLDNIMVGAHFIAAICGAAIGISGVYRLFVRRRRRDADN